MKFLLKELIVCVHLKYARSIIASKTDTEKELASFRELSENRLNDVTSLFQKECDCTCICTFLGSVNELSEKLETQQKINRVKRLENEDLRSNIKEKDEKIAGIRRMLLALIIYSNRH